MYKNILIASLLLVVTFVMVSILQSRNIEPHTPIANDGDAYEVVTQRDISYGAHPKKTYDVYRPEGVSNAPVIVMVHGGAWMVGDKANAKVVDNKRDHWVPAGSLLISVNYPMLSDDYQPDQQAEAVAEALLHIQNNVDAWGGDAAQMIVIGHSAGAHLVALITSQKPAYPGLESWAGSILLDSAALDVVSVMNDPPLRSFNRVFGDDQRYWETTSPYHVLSQATEPVFIVCSTERTGPCTDGESYQAKASQFGTKVRIYPINKTHEAINDELGLPSSYTEEVDTFIAEVL